jgi:hypothetical protein
MKKSLTAFILASFASALVFADGAMEYKSSFAETPSKVEISGLKERTDMTMPVIGEQQVITRVDKGVRWTIYPKKKAYSESPIALPYRKMDEGKPGRREKVRKSKEEAKECTPQMTKLSGGKTIAGMKSTGYEISCKESPKDKMTMWVGEETSASKKFMEEQQRFAAAHAKAMFANYPANERSDMNKATADMMSGLVKGIPKMAKDQNFPKGMWTRFEMSSESGPVTLFELVSISASGVPASRFELPAGYRKLKEGESAIGMGDLVSDEDKKGMKDGAKKEAADSAKKEAMKSLMKGFGNFGR